MSRSITPSEELAKFVADQDLDFEVFNPENLRFVTFNPERGLPTLYFEDDSGLLKGRIRQAHEDGPMIIFQGNCPRFFFSSGKFSIDKKEFIVTTTCVNLIDRDDGLTNSFIEVSGDEKSLYTDISITDFNFNKSEGGAAYNLVLGSELIEYYPNTRIIHESGGNVRKVEDFLDDALVKAVTNLHGRGGEVLLQEVFRLFSAQGNRSLVLRNGATSAERTIALSFGLKRALLQDRDFAEDLVLEAATGVGSLGYEEGEDFDNTHTSISKSLELKVLEKLSSSRENPIKKR